MSISHALQELFSRQTYRADYARAKVQHTCIVCEQIAIAFRDRASLFEYTVSAMCQQCQDHLFHATEKGERV